MAKVGNLGAIGGRRVDHLRSRVIVAKKMHGNGTKCPLNGMGHASTLSMVHWLLDLSQ